MSTFLELVNDCIDESKQALDHLTPADFATPSRTVLYNQLKNWVASGYQDLLEDNRSWFFANERGVVTIQPRLHIVVVDGVYVPTVGDTMVGDSSGVRWMVTEVFFAHEGDDTEYTISVRYDNVVPESELVQWETCTVMSGLDTYDSAVRVEGRGTYDLSQYIPTIDKVNQDSITVKHSVLNPDFNGDKAHITPSLRFVPYAQWTSLAHFYGAVGEPRFVTTTPSGALQFYPFPDGMYDVSFDYSQTAPKLMNWNDVPSLIPAKHHKILVWMALKELGDFNRDTRLYARADKKYKERLGWMMRDYLPAIKMDTTRFYRSF